MEIILTPHCKSVTGSLGKGYGYHIQRRKNHFFAKRNSLGVVPTDGQLRFIFDCAHIARMNIYFADVKCSAKELAAALHDAGKHAAAERVNYNITAANKHFYNASDIINLKITFGL